MADEKPDLRVNPRVALLRGDEPRSPPSRESEVRVAALREQLRPEAPPDEGGYDGGGWFSKMHPAEKAAQLAFLGLGLLDWGQTIKFTQDPYWQERVFEANPVLGKHPSRARVNTLIPLGLAAHTLAAWALPRPWRNVLQVGGLVGEGWATSHNHRDGIRPTLPWK